MCIARVCHVCESKPTIPGTEHRWGGPDSHAAARQHAYDVCARVTFSVDVWVSASHTAHGSYQENKKKKSPLFPLLHLFLFPLGTPVSPRCTGDDALTLPVVPGPHPGWPCATLSTKFCLQIGLLSPRGMLQRHLGERFPAQSRVC